MMPLEEHMSLSIQPVISYPHQAQVGKTYLVTVDLRQAGSCDWPYEEEEFSLYCILDAAPFFSSKPVGESVLVLHRFGGTYGPAKFYVTATQESEEGQIKILLINQWGAPISGLTISNICVTKETLETLELYSYQLPLSDIPQLSRAYYLSLVSRCRRLPLGSVDPWAAREEGSNDVPLAAIYTALLTRRAETDDAYAGIPKGGLPRRGLPKAPLLSALEVLNREKYLVLLGEPGSGKSTFVNFVALCLAGQYLGDEQANLAVLTTPLPELKSDREEKPYSQPWDHGALLPVRVVLRDFVARGLPETGVPADGGVLWTFIATELGESLKEYAPHLKQHLLKQGGLILLDGLDEVPDAHHRREQVKAAIEGFVRDFPACRFLVTSRTYAYQRQDWKLHDFSEAVLAPFSPVQIRAFVERWYAHVGSLRGMAAQDAQGKAQRLKEALERSPRLTELAERPLLLTLMASLHAWRGGSLPEKREELYADAVDLLLEQWEGCKVEHDGSGKPLVEQPALAEWLKVDREVVRAELDRLAFEAHRDQGTLEGAADIPQERLVSALLAVAANPQAKANPLELMGYLCDRAGLLVARGEGVYAFQHRTFQEYLAACHLTDHAFPRALVELLRGDPQRWREATLLAGAKAARGTASAVWNLAEALCHREPSQTRAAEADCWGALLAAQVLIENEGPRLAQVSEWDAPKLERVQRWMRAIVEHGWLPVVDRALAGNALAVLGDDRDLEALVEVPAGPFLMGSSDKDSQAFDGEKPQHEVVLPTFRIGKYPVTVAQYRRFVEATGREWRWDEIRPERSNHPVVNVTWYDAQAYCAWLTQVWREEGKIGTGEIVRLPTEAEWEKAARGTEGRIYPWGNEWDAAKCNTSEAGLGSTTLVGMFPEGASPYGCLDMAGNVWEWTQSLWGKDWNEPDFKYPYDPADGRENLEAGSDILRVLRGRAFTIQAKLSYCARRISRRPSEEDAHFGFRIALIPSSFSSHSPSVSSKTFTQGHALIIGVGADLPNTVWDAQGIASLLKDPERCGYPDDQVQLLTGPEATREAILAALDRLAVSTDTKATVVIYFSGHGYKAASTLGEAYYLMSYGYDVTRLYQTAISGQEFTQKLRAIPAQKLLLLLDCCHAGGVGEANAPGVALAKSPLPSEAVELFSQGSGHVLIASSQEDELSYAGKPYSVFTLALIESLSGIGVTKKDGYVRVTDVALHAREIVPGRTRGKQHLILHFEHADNFALAYYAGGDYTPKGLPFAEASQIEIEHKLVTAKPKYSSREFINREIEISFVLSKIQDLKLSQCDRRVIILLGERGTGKSWLLCRLQELTNKECKTLLIDSGKYVGQEPALVVMELLNQLHDLVKPLRGELGKTLPELSRNLAAREKGKKESPKRSGKTLPELSRNLVAREKGKKESPKRSGKTLSELSRNLVADLRKLTADKPLVLLVDHVYESDWELLSVLEDYLLGPLSLEPRVLLVMAGRGRPYPFKTLELRLQADFCDLQPFSEAHTAEQINRHFNLLDEAGSRYLDSRAHTAEQLDRQFDQGKKKAPLKVSEIYRMSGGNPLANILLATSANPSKALDQVIEGMLEIVPSDLRHQVREYMEALCVLQAFDEERIPIMLAAYYKDDRYKKWSYAQARQVREILVKWGFALWDVKEGAYAMDATTQKLLGHYLEMAQPRVGRGTWRELHYAALELYTNWVEQYPRSKEHWRKEQEYHAAQLDRVSYFW